MKFPKNNINALLLIYLFTQILTKKKKKEDQLQKKKKKKGVREKKEIE